MKKITAILLFLVFISCKAQLPKVKNLSNNQQLNYIFANIFPKEIMRKELYRGGLFVTIFQISDSKGTPKDYFEDGHEILYSLIISVEPDGAYTDSRLYKIEGLYNHKIEEIKETKYPKFSIKIEHGFYDKRKIELFEFEGVQ